MNPAIPLHPPLEWFTPPTTMPKDSGCIVESDGRIYGYLCHWGSVLMDGSKDRWTPPKSRSEYSYAHTGDTQLDDGALLKTANLGGDFGHAPVGAGNIADTQDFYANTQTQLARIRYGEDDHGVWFAGALWPTASEFDIAKLRASARSGHWAAIGDWRDIHSGRAGYELVGACLVNVPGLKYARADRAASGVFTFNPCRFATEANHAGSMVALYLESTIAKELAVAGGEAPEHLHITLAYFEDEAADRDDWAAIETLVSNVGAKHLPLAGKIGGQGVFKQEDGDVHWAHPDIPGLESMREELVAGLDLAGFAVRKDHGFSPHITIAYCGSGDDAPEILHGVDIAFDRLTLSVGNDTKELAATCEPNGVSVQQMIHRVAASGTLELAHEEETPAPSGKEHPVGGILVVEDSPTEDGRLIDAGATEWRELPLPLYSSLQNLPGHDSAALVGRIDSIERDEADAKILRWTGVVIEGKSEGAGDATLAAIQDKTLRGVSIDGAGGISDSYWDEQNEVERITRIVIVGATLTPMPAIREASVTLLQNEQEDSDVSSEATETAEALSAETMQTDDEATDGDTTDAADDTAATDAADTAMTDKVDAVFDRLEYLITLVESWQMDTRHAAALKRIDG